MEYTRTTYDYNGGECHVKAAKTMQVLKTNVGGVKHECIKDLTTHSNAYRLYKWSWVMGKNGYPVQRRTLIDKYDDFKSVLLALANLW